MEIYAALFVELLRGVEVERIASDTAAQTIGSDVAQRSAFPRICYGEYEAAIAPHKNILFFLARRRRSAICFWFDTAHGSRASWQTLYWRRVVGDFLVIGGGRLRVGNL